jgi:polyhydroxyalkanoate synthase
MPPKRRFHVGRAHRGQAADAWHATAQEHSGTWWEDWRDWLAERCGGAPGSTQDFPNLADAPGTYVLER